MATPNWGEYLKNNKDVSLYANDIRQAGIAGSEQDWINNANKAYGTNATDASQFSPEQLGKLHYDVYGRGEGRNAAGLGYYGDAAYGNMSAEDKAVIDKQQFQNQYGGMGEATKKDFDTLLGRLEGSKIRQEEAKNVSARPGIYAAGLANMMRNF